MKSSRQVVVYATAGHGPQGGQRHVQRRLVAGSRVMTQQEIEDDRPRKLRCLPKPTVGCVIARAEALIDLIQDRGAELRRANRGAHLR